MDEVESFLSEHVARECYEEIAETGRIRCLVTGHEMPRSLIGVKTHFLGRKFRSKVDQWKPGFDFAQFEPHIVEERSNPRHFLFCRLTRCTLPRLAAAVEAHVAGRRFQSALALQKKEEQEIENDDGVDPEEMAEVMRDDVDLLWTGELVQSGDEQEEQDEIEIGEDQDRGRELVELEKDVFVFQGRNKRKKSGK